MADRPSENQPRAAGPPPRRIVSLVPHATELLFALGLGDRVVGVTHECDAPAAALALPHVTADVLPPGLSAAEIDRAVRERTARGEAIYRLDEQRLAELDPDLIVTQELCPVCAVSYDEVAAVARELPRCPDVIALDPHTFGETLGDVRTLAGACDVKDAGVDLVAEISRRVDAVRIAVRGVERPRVVAVEWFDPVFTGGHWTPQLIEMAGGTDLCGLPGERSETTTWEALRALEPDVVVCIPCGYDGDRALVEANGFADRLWSTGARRVVALDASAYFSRPGPRLVAGLELLAHVLHPERFPTPPDVVHEVARPTAGARA
ncbi:ABC transporter substrate-binding protein [Patulibacter defluvii]|uniref:ABC transporter substrate-binding protein n=1 Tax=Patulibacter defluvii TaxID=3095358 RepID=UPI002A75D926|nr:ABC transporter substrate-binding protein [Patulibacter sp. DM4]